MKKVFYAILILVFLFSLCQLQTLGYSGNGAVIITDAEPGYLTPMTIAGTEVQWTGSIPLVSIPYNEYLSFEINNKIREVCTDKLALAANSSARNVTFRYDYKFWNNYDSILIYVTTTHNQTKEEVVSINFDLSKNVLISINDLLGINAAALINIGVANEIRKSPDSFNVGFSGVDSKINFFVEDGRVFALFDKYEIAPGSRGIVSIPIDLARIKNFVISYLDYLTKPAQYVLKLVPLKLVCDMLGFGIITDSITGVIDIYKGDVVITCVIGVNNYYRLGEPPKSLESPPEEYFGEVYVPVSFLEQLMGAAYSIDYEDNIVISYIE